MVKARSEMKRLWSSRSYIALCKLIILVSFLTVSCSTLVKKVSSVDEIKKSVTDSLSSTSHKESSVVKGDLEIVNNLTSRSTDNNELKEDKNLVTEVRVTDDLTLSLSASDSVLFDKKTGALKIFAPADLSISSSSQVDNLDNRSESRTSSAASDKDVGVKDSWRESQSSLNSLDRTENSQVNSTSSEIRRENRVKERTRSLFIWLPWLIILFMLVRYVYRNRFALLLWYKTKFKHL